jgi:transposase
MPMERMSMRQVRECLRLKSAGISTREIARRVGVASSTVRLTLRRCGAAEIACPLDAGFTDAVLEQLLFANAGVKPSHRRHAEPDWAVLRFDMFLSTVEIASQYGVSPATIYRRRAF